MILISSTIQVARWKLSSTRLSQPNCKGPTTRSAGIVCVTRIQPSKLIWWSLKIEGRSRIAKGLPRSIAAHPRAIRQTFVPRQPLGGSRIVTSRKKTAEYAMDSGWTALTLPRTVLVSGSPAKTAERAVPLLHVMSSVLGTLNAWTEANKAMQLQPLKRTANECVLHKRLTFWWYLENGLARAAPFFRGEPGKLAFLESMNKSQCQIYKSCLIIVYL